MISSKFSRSLLLLAMLAFPAVSRLSATTILDTVTNASNFTFTGSTPRTYMGDGFTNTSLNANSRIAVTDISVFLVSATAQTYTDVLARIQFYNSYDPNALSVFSNPAGPLLTIDLGMQTFAANTIYQFNITLPTPTSITLMGNNFGFAQNFQGSTVIGVAPADTTNLTSLITYNTGATGFAAGQITTGGAPNYGYYRNASGRTDFNFIGNSGTTDQRSLGFANQGIGIIINGTITQVPEPSTYAMMAGGVAMLGAMMRFRRRSS